jgi:ferredoxin
MRLVVDLTKCQGYGQCAFMAPSTFVMDGEEGLHFVAEPPDAERERVLRAAAAARCRRSRWSWTRMADSRRQPRGLPMRNG